MRPKTEWTGEVGTGRPGVKDAEVKRIDQEVATLLKKQGGSLQAEDIVRAAKFRGSPLNKHFQWDDERAAEKYRLAQARTVLKTVKAIVVTTLGEKKVPKYVNVRRSEGVKNILKKRRGYIPLDVALYHDEPRDQILGYALNQVTLWKERYEIYKELAPIFNAIEKVKSKLKPRRKPVEV